MFEPNDARERVDSAPRQPAKTATNNPKETAQRGLSGPAGQLPHLGQLEQSFGRNLSGVPCYSGDSATQSAHELGAHAYAYKGSVVLGDRSDVRTTAEETAHALQQTHDFSAFRTNSAMTTPGDGAELEAQNVAHNVAAGAAAGALNAGLGFETVARAKVKDWDNEGNANVNERKRGPQRKEGVHGTHRGRDAKRAHDAEFERVCQEGNISRESGQRTRLHQAIGGGSLDYAGIKAVAMQLKLGIWK